MPKKLTRTYSVTCFTYSVTLKLYIKGDEGVMLDNLSIIQFYGFLSHFLTVYFFFEVF